MSDDQVLQRALALAHSGRVSGTTEIRRCLASEGFSYAQIAAVLDGRGMQRILRAAMKAARGAAPSAVP